MLQWMGGGRRKVKTTKKSVQARQHHFFEQRRQQMRSQAPKELNPDKLLREEGNVCSLDIASLKKLYQLAQSCAANPLKDTQGIMISSGVIVNYCNEDNARKSAISPDEFKMPATLVNESMLCQEEKASVYQSGSQPPGTHDMVTHLTTTVGTQWTPTSAAAAAAAATATTVSSHPKALVSEKRQAFLPKDLNFKNEVFPQEKKAEKAQVSSKQEKKMRIDGARKRQSQQRRREQFQLLDLINDGNDSIPNKKNVQLENYAAYVLEGMGKVSNCTPRFDQAVHKKFKCKDARPANSKHEKKQPSHGTSQETGKQARCGVQLQRHTVEDDESNTLTNFESFSDSNGEHYVGQCVTSNCGSLNDEYSRESCVWERSSNMDSNVDWLFSEALHKDQGFLDSNLSARRHHNHFKIPNSIKESKSSSYPDFEFASTSDQLDDLLYDKVHVGNAHGIGNSLPERFQIGHFKDDELLGCFNSSSPSVSPRGLCEKAPCEFSFDSPSAEVYSDSTFEFQVTVLESGMLKRALASPALWKSGLDPACQYPNSISGYSEDENEFDSLYMAKHDNAETFLPGNLRAESSSSVDTLFGTNKWDLPPSPTSPLLSQSPQFKLNFGRNVSNNSESNFFTPFG